MQIARGKRSQTVTRKPFHFGDLQRGDSSAAEVVASEAKVKYTVLENMTSSL
jgi:hypothetical protein